MRVLTAIVLVALGIWIAYNKPEIADIAIGYINMAIEFIKSMLDKLGQ